MFSIKMNKEIVNWITVCFCEYRNIIRIPGIKGNFFGQLNSTLKFC